MSNLRQGCQADRLLRLLQHRHPDVRHRGGARHHRFETQGDTEGGPLEEEVRALRGDLQEMLQAAQRGGLPGDPAQEHQG